MKLFQHDEEACPICQDEYGETWGGGRPGAWATIGLGFWLGVLMVLWFFGGFR